MTGERIDDTETTTVPPDNNKSEDQQEVDKDIISKDNQEAQETQNHPLKIKKGNGEKVRKDGDPSEVLWVGFPLYIKVDERRLHRAFSSFGAIERITTFPGRTYAFVQFQSVRAASRAKDALQGRLFNDPRVSISFAKSEMGPTDHGKRMNDMLPLLSKAELPSLIPLSKPGHPMNPRNDRFLGLRGSRTGGPSDRWAVDEFFHNSHHEKEQYPILRDNLGHAMKRSHDHDPWGSGPHMPKGMFPHDNHAFESQDVWNTAAGTVGKMDLKRQGIVLDSCRDNIGLGKHSSFGIRSNESVGSHDLVLRGPPEGNVGFQQPTFRGPRAPVGSWENVGASQHHLLVRSSPPSSTREPPPALVNDRAPSAVLVDPMKAACQWRGLIAKSGTPVCCVRTYATSNRIDIPFPDIVNCTARTSLDILASHMGQICDFAVVSFVPDGELDVIPYQEFMNYLSEKKRAAVCKLSLEITLFLVPPTQFIDQFLKMPQSLAIFGVILKLPSQDVMPSQAFTEGFGAPAQHLLLQPSEAQLNELPVVQPLFNDNVLPTGLPSATMPSTEMMIPMNNLHPLQSTVQVKVNASNPPLISTYSNAPIAQSNVANGGLQSIPSMVHEQHMLPLMGSHGLANAQEQGTQMHIISVAPTGQMVPIPEGLPVIQGSTPVALTSERIQFQPPLPPYPRPPNVLQSTSAPGLLPQPSHSYQHSAPQSQLTTNGLMHVQPMLANGPAQEAWPLGNMYQAGPAFGNTGHPQVMVAPVMQQSSFPGAQSERGGQVIPSNPQQQASLQGSQLILPVGSSMKDEGDESKKFQATLQLAAALLQQLQQKSET